MRIVGGLCILVGFLLCLSIVGAIFGVPLIMVGCGLAAFGGRRKVVINNTVTVANTVGPAREESGTFHPAPSQRVERHAITAPPRAAALSAPIEPFDRNKWQTLVRYDDELRAAAERIRALGSKWEDELAEEYLKINDKTYLLKIVQRIEADAGSSA